MILQPLTMMLSTSMSCVCYGESCICYGELLIDLQRIRRRLLDSERHLIAARDFAGLTFRPTRPSVSGNVCLGTNRKLVSRCIDGVWRPPTYIFAAQCTDRRKHSVGCTPLARGARLHSAVLRISPDESIVQRSRMTSFMRTMSDATRTKLSGEDSLFVPTSNTLMQFDENRA